jgi:hypothetical protein
MPRLAANSAAVIQQNPCATDSTAAGVNPSSAFVTLRHRRLLVANSQDE